MWSPYYSYFTIRKDRHYSSSKPSSEVVDILVKNFGFTVSGVDSFKNGDAALGMDCLIGFSEDGNFSSASDLPEFVNFISIVAFNGVFRTEIQLQVLIDISKKLQWELIEDFHEGEEDGEDDGEEGKIIWTPIEN